MRRWVSLLVGAVSVLGLTLAVGERDERRRAAPPLAATEVSDAAPRVAEPAERAEAADAAPEDVLGESEAKRVVRAASAAQALFLVCIRGSSRIF